MAKETCVAASSSGVQIADDLIFEEDDACSICLEPFSAFDPSTVTGCKHEYHFHCILEWSQRSQECPICWQFLMLKDPVCQELLAAAGAERAARSSGNVQQPVVREFHHEAPFINDSDYEERIMQHLAARYYQRKKRQSPQCSSSGPSAYMSNMQQTINLQGECPTTGDRQPVKRCDSSTSSEFPSLSIGESSSVNIRDCLLIPSSPPINGSRKSSSSELLTFSNSIRSKFSAASTRCKESISKGTNGFKEKLLARNTTVKELSREVQREMNAGIAGVAKMIERLDLSSKRTGASTFVSSYKVESSNLANNGNDVQDKIFVRAPSQIIEPSTEMLSSDRSSSVASKTISKQVEVSSLRL